MSDDLNSMKMYMWTSFDSKMLTFVFGLVLPVMSVNINFKLGLETTSMAYVCTINILRASV